MAVYQITCSGDEEVISECGFEFFTPELTCDQQNVAGLRCKGTIPTQ